MAKSNMPSASDKKKTPTQLRLSFEGTGNTTTFIDTALALSAVNRRMYRQGLYYYINSVEVYNNNTGVLDLHTVPDTWVTQMAHRRASLIFDKMNDQVGEPLSAIQPKWHDFKVYLNALHATTGSMQPSLHTINGNSQTQLSDDWVYSQFTSADNEPANPVNADEFTGHLLGVHTPDASGASSWDSIGIIKSYAETRSTVQPEDPGDNNIDITDPLLNLFDYSSEEVINDIAENLLNDNDNPPYNYNQYPGEATTTLQHVARIGTEVGVGRVGRSAGFCAPYGLICVDPWGLPAGDDKWRVVINLAAGSYKGVYAERA